MCSVRFLFSTRVISSMQTIAQYTVAAFGVVIAGAGLWALVAPKELITLINKLFDGPAGMRVAVGERLLLGVALLMAAPGSAFPLLFNVFGGLTLVAALVILFSGRERVKAILGWVERIPLLAMRCWLLVGIAFGGFLVYAAVLS